MRVAMMTPTKNSALHLQQQQHDISLALNPPLSVQTPAYRKAVPLLRPHLNLLDVPGPVVFVIRLAAIGKMHGMRTGSSVSWRASRIQTSHTALCLRENALLHEQSLTRSWFHCLAQVERLYERACSGIHGMSHARSGFMQSTIKLRGYLRHT